MKLAVIVLVLLRAKASFPVLTKKCPSFFIQGEDWGYWELRFLLLHDLEGKKLDGTISWHIFMLRARIIPRKFWEMAEEEDSGLISSNNSSGSTSQDDYLAISDGGEEDEEFFGDPCHEFEHSIVFFTILILFLGTTVAYCVLLYRRWVTSLAIKCF